MISDRDELIEEKKRQIESIVKEAINDLRSFRITLKDFKRYKHTYDVLNDDCSLKSSLGYALLNVAVCVKTDLEEVELNDLREGIRFGMSCKVLTKVN